MTPYVRKKRFLIQTVAALGLIQGAYASQTLGAEAAHDHGAPAAAAEHMHDAPPAASADQAMHMHEAAADHAGHGAADGAHAHMAGALGSYSMMRDASGTSWQPDSTPMEGLAGQIGDWSGMLHGWVNFVFDHQGGKRGGEKTFSESMLMGMAQKSAAGGTLTLRGMVSLDPLMGKSGYPLLLQTGETANGVDPLIDRQHPHDFLMELAAIYSVPLSANQSVFLYAGYPGEPALGPPAFMHRFSAGPNPEAPIGHHWLDATHVTFGVITGGFVWDNWKIEASAFNGREPDQYRWDFDSVRLDSGSARLSWNPTPNWSMQASWGYIHSPEGLEPGIDQRRTTASISYNRPFTDGNWQTTLAWGRNDKAPGPALDAWLLESAVAWKQHTLFGRVENDQKDELFEAPHPLAGRTFDVSKFSLGYVYDIPVAEHLKLGFGAVGSLHALPSALHASYGGDPASYMLFTRVAIH